jgi:hypothetical protein
MLVRGNACWNKFCEIKCLLEKNVVREDHVGTNVMRADIVRTNVLEQFFRTNVLEQMF